MQQNDLRNLRILWWVVRAGFVLCFLALTWWQIMEGGRLGEDGRDPRNVWAVTHVGRGGIFAAGGEVLAESVFLPEGVARRYSLPGAVHTIGYLSPRYGSSGLEKEYAPWLLGQGRVWWRGVFGDFPAEKGYSLYTTLSFAVEREAVEVLRGKRGAVVALDPRNGAILAMASSPWVNPVDLEAVWESPAGKKGAPFLNRAVMGVYPPGSTLKPFIAAAAMQYGLVTPDTRFYCPGKRVLGKDEITCLGGAHGDLDLTGALSVSCNYVFSGLALQLGKERLTQALQSFGFGEVTPLEIPTGKGYVPAIEKKPLRELAELGIGQGDILVTPLQMAVACASIANAGRGMEPYLVSEMREPDGRAAWRRSPGLWGYPMVASTARAVGGMMESVVDSGTGIRARLPGIRTAGKTGSAENPHGASHAWFIGYAPVEDPRVVVVIAIENGGYGGSVAAPLGARVMEAALSSVK